jgi:Ser/Thr protein kinase RdoA (MazF antagonist)
MLWSGESARSALRRAGITLDLAEVRLEAREERQVASLPGDLVAWFAESELGKDRMARERRVLRLIASRCSFAVPRVLYEPDDESFDVRAAVPGLVDPWRVFERMTGDAAAARRMGAEIGTILAEQHTRIRAEDAAAWLPSRALWPEPSAWIRERLPRVVAGAGDNGLIARIDEMLARYDAVPVTDADRALIHSDVGFHNLALDPETYAVRGIFDYEGASWADRHHDFRYLLFDRGHEEMLDAALAVYEPTVGRILSRERIRLYNAAAAASFLAFRDGIPADTRWCGRTLAEDLAWVRYALERCMVQ